MRKKIIRGAEIVAGVSLIIAGAALGFVVFIPGFPLAIVGVLLISPHHGRRLLHTIENAWKKLIKKQYKDAGRELLKFFKKDSIIDRGKFVDDAIDKFKTWKKSKFGK